jgi:hypothetical protein
MLGGRPYVVLRHCRTLASVGAILAERSLSVIKERLFEINEVPEAMGVAST